MCFFMIISMQKVNVLWKDNKSEQGDYRLINLIFITCIILDSIGLNAMSSFRETFLVQDSF